MKNIVQYIALCTLLITSTTRLVCLQEQPVEQQQLIYTEQLAAQNPIIDIATYEQKYRTRCMHDAIATIGGLVGASIAKEMATKAACLLLSTYSQPNGLTVTSMLLTVAIPAIAGGAFLGYNATRLGCKSITCIKKLFAKKPGTREPILPAEDNEL